jgi:hypothetical protein
MLALDHMVRSQITQDTAREVMRRMQTVWHNLHSEQSFGSEPQLEFFSL